MNRCTFHFLLFTILTLPLTPLCSFGCLSCDTFSQSCLYCDNLSGYYLSNGGCSYSDLTPNCLIIGSHGACVFCHLDYSLIGANCVTKSSLSAKDGQCTVFDATRACEVRSIGSFYRDLVFLTGLRQIPNCLKYSLDQKCINCVPGYWTYFDGSSCQRIDRGSSLCSVYSFTPCVSCEVGYKFDRNVRVHSLNSRLTDVDVSSLNFSKTIVNKSFTSSVLPHDPCLRTAGVTCQSEGVDGNCLLCVDGMALNAQFNCVPKPLPSIPNCRGYLHDLTCLDCVPGHYLASTSDCRPVIPIPNCRDYDTSASSTKCLTCTSQHYVIVVDGQTICSPRVQSLVLPHCQTLTPNADTCHTCLPSFFLHTDQLTCLPSLDHCLTYLVTPVPSSHFSVTCQVCTLGFQPSHDICLPLSSPNCETMADGKCTICLQGYYLSQETCVVNTNTDLMSICQRSSSIDPLQCDACNYLSVPVTLVDGCSLVANPVPFCVTYDLDGFCVTCDTGLLLSDNICVHPPDSIICLSPSGNAMTPCLKCRSGFVVDPLLGTCVEIPPFITANCDVLDHSRIFPSCQSCSAGYSPVVFDGPLTYCIHLSSKNTPIGLPSLSNCLTYSWEPSRCHTCDTQYFVRQSDGACIPQLECKTGVFLEYFELQDGRPLSSAVLMCSTIDFVPNCKYYALNVMWSTNDTRTAMNPLTYICTTCRSQHMPGEVPAPGSKYTYSTFVRNSAHVYSSGSTSQSFTDRYPGISACLPVGDLWAATYISLNTFLNCQAVVTGYSIEERRDFFGCVQCQFGYTGTLVQTSSTTYINKCSSMSECLTSVFYNGLGSLEGQLKFANSTNGTYPQVPLSTLVTCHACIDPNKIPFLPMLNAVGDSVSIGTWYLNMLFRYDVSLSIPVNVPSSTTSNNFIQCLDPRSIAAVNNIDPSINSFPSNCAVGVMYTNRVVNLQTSSRVSHLCIACKPGFKATLIPPFMDPNTGKLINEYSFAVARCTLIPHCTTSTLFNGCSTCDSGYSLLWDVVGRKPDISTCVPSVSNCMYPTLDGLCGLCNRAFILHPNGVCYAADFKGCNLAYTYMSPGLDLPDGKRPLDLGYMAHYLANNLAIGCGNCDSVFQETSRVFTNVVSCMKNPFNTLDSEGRVVAGTETLPNCQSMSVVNGRINCVKCNIGFVVVTGGLTCTSLNPYLVNCSVSSATGTCLTCNPGYLLTDGVCLLNPIQNCMTLNDAGECSECLPDFVLVDSVCAYVKELHCGSMDLSKSDVGQLTCTSCSSFHYSNTSPSTINTCLKVGVSVSNCDVGARSSLGVVLCTKCQQGYYLANEGRSCVVLPVVPDCRTYSETQGVCQQCIDGRFLSSDSLTCTLNPTGLPHCAEYLTLFSCRECHPASYLKDGKCLALPSDHLVYNCRSYKLSLFGVECALCNEGFYIEGNECVFSNAKDCLRNFNPNVCLNCRPFHVLQTSGNVTSCVKVTLPGCVEYTHDSSGKVTCLRCQFGMTLFSPTTCVLYPSFISNCLEYDIVTNLCVKCLPEYILSDNGQYCMLASAFDGLFKDTCSGKTFVSSPVCVQCGPGAYFDDFGNCVPCLTDDSCMYCEPKYPSRCKVCARGHYMDGAGVCGPNTDSQVKATSMTATSEGGREMVWSGVMMGIVMWMMLN